MKKAYYIDYPQEHIEGQAHAYRCASCKEVTTKINGRLQGHLASCEYRLKLEREGYELSDCSAAVNHDVADDYD